MEAVDEITEAKEKADAFTETCQRELQRIIAVQAIWTDALAYGLEIPYDAYRGSTYTNVAIYHYVFNEEESKHESIFSEEETQQVFAKIMRWARKNGYGVEKKYDDEDFNLWVDPHDDIVGKINFYSTRKVVCTKRVVGTKVVPARTEEIVEWDCEKVAFSKLTND